MIKVMTLKEAWELVETIFPKSNTFLESIVFTDKTEDDFVTITDNIEYCYYVSGQIFKAESSLGIELLVSKLETLQEIHDFYLPHVKVFLYKEDLPDTAFDYMSSKREEYTLKIKELKQKIDKLRTIHSIELDVRK